MVLGITALKAASRTRRSTAAAELGPTRSDRTPTTPTPAARRRPLQTISTIQPQAAGLPTHHRGSAAGKLSSRSTDQTERSAGTRFITDRYAYRPLRNSAIGSEDFDLTGHRRGQPPASIGGESAKPGCSARRRTQRRRRHVVAQLERSTHEDGNARCASSPSRRVLDGVRSDRRWSPAIQRSRSTTTASTSADQVRQARRPHARRKQQRLPSAPSRGAPLEPIIDDVTARDVALSRSATGAEPTAAARAPPTRSEQLRRRRPSTVRSARWFGYCCSD